MTPPIGFAVTILVSVSAGGVTPWWPLKTDASLRKLSFFIRSMLQTQGYLTLSYKITLFIDLLLSSSGTIK